MKGKCHLITPDSIHKVVLPQTHYGVSLAVRTRAVKIVSHELNEQTGEIAERSKSARDRFAALSDLFADPIRSFDEPALAL